jgi:ketosteroid isomerase-like protein
MSLRLPDLLTNFFAAENSGDAESLGACFADHAVVRDEGRTFEGVAAIEQWMRDAKKKYQHTAEPIEVVRRDGKTIVTTRVSGNFAGSPVNLEHIFGIEGDKIASLEIR